MKRRTVRIMICGIISLMIVYLAMNIWMIASVKETLRTLYLHPEKDSQMINSYVTESTLKKFYRQEIYPANAGDKIIFSTSMGFGIHYFYKGTLWIRYTFEGINNETKAIKYGSSNVPIRLKVKLVHGKWKIIDKFEAA